MVMVLEAHAAFTPAGNPVAAPMPVAPVVPWVMTVSKPLIHRVGDEEAAVTVFIEVGVTIKVCDVPFPQELEGVTVIVPAVVPAVTVILLEVCPAVIFHPRGMPQV